MNGLDKTVMKRALAILLGAILVGGVAHAVFIDVFNKTEHSTTGADATQSAFLKFDDRKDSTSTWVKRDYNLNGEAVDLQAQTVDGTLYNNTDDAIASWVATINVQGDCFINNAWTGTVEIHQHVGTDKEKTQTLDLRDYNLADVKLDYLYDGDLLIPLQKGDRVVYYPSEKDELTVAPRGELTMGMIFYYLNDLNLSNYSIDYYYHRDFTYGPGFIGLMLLAIVWVLLLAGTIVADISYKRAMRESALRNSGLSSMSSIYSVINFIDLKTNTLIPVYADEKTQEVLPQGEGAKEKLLDIFGRDTTAPYRAAVLEFVNTDTLAERLRNGSIALEYVSKAYGWSQVRFFPVDPDEGKPLERALLTIQDINDEKQKLERFEQHSAQVELESNMRSIVVSGLSNGMSSSVGIIDDLAAKIASESDDESVCKDANHIRDHAKALTYLIDATMDSTARSSEDLKSKPEGYVLSDMIADACTVVGTVVTNKELTFDIEVSPSIPKRLIGDKRRIERALIGLLSYATRPESVTTAKLSAYGAEHDGKEHVLFSVKTDGKGLSDKDAHTVSVFLSDLEQYDAHAIDAGHEELESVALLLLHMESELKIVNDPGEGLELYFEIEQQIPNSPVDGSNDEA